MVSVRSESLTETSGRRSASCWRERETISSSSGKRDLPGADDDSRQQPGDACARRLAGNFGIDNMATCQRTRSSLVSAQGPAQPHFAQTSIDELLYFTLGPGIVKMVRAVQT